MKEKQKEKKELSHVTLPVLLLLEKRRIIQETEATILQKRTTTERKEATIRTVIVDMPNVKIEATLEAKIGILVREVFETTTEETTVVKEVLDLIVVSDLQESQENKESQFHCPLNHLLLHSLETFLLMFEKTTCSSSLEQKSR
jgi:hypothetical protein